ncbi:MAG: hypothetical protein BJ554DRAFT_732, partial [Olpidium bornovanus]
MNALPRLLLLVSRPGAGRLVPKGPASVLRSLLPRNDARSPRHLFSSGRGPALKEAAAAATPVDGGPPECYVVELVGDDKGIVVLTLNRPAARNALSRRMVAEFYRSLEAIKRSQDARVVIVKSEVDNVFCAGADLKVPCFSQTQK